jgi:Na+-translocating ferredoxin:NAD+ oxidoreductase RNF subunit RnfB
LLPSKNCGACGAPDCETLAEDVVRGEARIDDCVFLKIESLQRQVAQAKGGTDE